ncbi:disks large-associated protein 5 isoform 2-T2 [Odontesthes bonariensis]|uniref:disks large-associated protein 5 isoform X2 n=1 Tax=Odontesthes bonariensis TaxID=219752 RepID=UPI003F58F317
MESRFAHLRQRDTSVSMLRVKMSRRKSQSLKENRERSVNTRRQLHKLQELEMSCLDASIAAANMSTIQETQNDPPVKTKAQERVKQLERWKERKALEKEKREREHKQIFKTGVYQPKDDLTVVSLPVVLTATTRPKQKKVNLAPTQSSRVTRSMKQQQHEAPKPLKMQDTNIGAQTVRPAVERSTRTRVAPVKPAPTATKTRVCAGQTTVTGPVVQASSTRSANRPPVTKAPVVKDKPKDRVADVRATRTRAVVNTVAPPSGGRGDCKAVSNTTHPAIAKMSTSEPELKERQVQQSEKPLCPSSPSSCSTEEDMMVDQAPEGSDPAVDAALPSFAPEGFVFEAPVGLSLFKFDPLTPRSANAFLTPSPTFNFPPAPAFTVEPEAEPSKPSPPKTPHCSPPPKSSTVAPPIPGTPLELKHDVPYFRSEIVNETERLTTLSLHWESKVEDESIPEEMRDRMRTAIGQARLLMKERFNQFGGLVDDCELGRGEKITTCTDLQGFWDMVYYQVEDVKKKFEALKAAEDRGWVEEHKPPPRQRKVVKKPSAAPAKPAGPKAAAKSRLAAVKAAMKARQQAAEAEREAKDAGSTDSDPSAQEPPPQTGAQTLETVVFNGGFFRVESPAKPPVRRSSRLSAAMLPQASPCSTYLSPRRVTRRSLALAQTPVYARASPAQPVHTPVQLRLTLEQTPAPTSQRGTPQLSRNRAGTVNSSLCFSPVKEGLSGEAQSESDSSQQSESVSTQEDAASLPALGTPVQMLPTVSVEQEQETPAEAVNNGLPATPRLSFSPCETPPRVQAPEPSAALSFMLSPCITPGLPPISSPAATVPVETQQSACHTPEISVIEEIPGLDFERYLQPSQRGSLSPRETVAGETLLPMAEDVEMESPRSQPEELLTQQEPALSALFTLQSAQVQTADSALLLFTPDLKDRIRQSVCPNDLMVFTPPDI